MRKPPSLRHHKASGQGVVRLNGKDHYLGRFGTDGARENYDRLISEWLANGRNILSADALTINELMLRYLRFASGYYLKGGKTTTQYDLIRQAVRPLKRLYGSLPAAEFSPLKLKAVRQAFVDSGVSRGTANRYVGLIKGMYQWACADELIAAPVYEALKAVKGLARGRTTAREVEPVGPVPDAHVDAVLEHVSPIICGMIRFQRLTGARPGEVCGLRAADIDMSGRNWVYRVSGHKAEHHGQIREIFIGPRAQTVLREFLSTRRTAFLFAPNKTGSNPRYSTSSYNYAIRRGCIKAFGLDEDGRPLLRWFPNQLRHNFATAVRKDYDLDAARILLGHSDATTTLTYAERDREKALSVISQVG